MTIAKGVVRPNPMHSVRNRRRECPSCYPIVARNNSIGKIRLRLKFSFIRELAQLGNKRTFWTFLIGDHFMVTLWRLETHMAYCLWKYYSELPVGSSILITDIESELSDAINANNHVKFKWKSLRKQVPFTVPRLHNIFNQVYNNTFD